MAHYNIELRTAGKVWETLAVDSAGIPDLRIELAQFVGELLKDHAGKIWVDEDWRIDVTDASGLILYVMNVVATESAATMPLPR